MFIPNWKTYLWDNWHLSPLIIRLTNRVSCTACNHSQHKEVEWPGGHFKNAYELLNLRALKIQCCIKIMFQYMGKIFQRYPLKFQTKYLTHILKYVYVIHRWKFKHPPPPIPHPPEPCIITPIWSCRNNFSQWQCGLQRKLHSHWLKSWQQRHVAVEIQPSITKFWWFCP